ncbi:breast cancer type 2 susceptibility protein homolog [Sitophilus oryzae]|uniref:Breast cancer type 2 susceptibility protein homolog n=1 Tax=Sitophilus oryzae TaxID=7048 RepID=A0A6J2XSV1_SITOR|nr:breast cancer type 2 susceptibility protein homolog [Sitophilus oryzae]
MDGGLINQVNPQNAHLVHFVLDKRISHQRTQDGAIIVSNTDNRVGVSEIEHSFKILEGVDPNLIPNGWIKNHFKWIVWKLASYERTCKKFEGCLNLENIIQQLKYRYDMEIDRVKRSALRKIFEKDDCPKKTMVLCVSKIVKNNDTYELELTDGWYPIRTVIDKPLSDQVVKNKIRLGVKLITSGAELVNCEGCFPLEAPDTTFLKINYNSTRRAIWWAQLGYQKNATPFPIPISSINFEGGRVGCVRCTIFRVYPVTYLEKNNNRHVRRNQRAEELCDHNFESNRLKEIEKINNRKQNSSRNNLSVQINNKLLKDIRNIKEPDVLYEICKNAEAEDLQDLSTEQQDLLNDYVKKKIAVEQHEALKQMNDIHKLIPNRSTTAVLKIKILDTSCTSNKSYDLHIWNPQESHFLELKEGNIITVYNVSCSSKWGLTTSHSTQFLREPKMENNTYTPFERKVTRIRDLQKFQSLLSNFNEFDTVGLPIMKTVNNSQELWIADSDKNLLRVKIFEPPDKILLLDKVEVGRPISLCNLTFESICDKYAYAIGDFHTTVSRYPQSKYLQDELNELENILKTTDLKSIVEICKSRICNIIGPTAEKLNSDIDEMACSQMTATDFVLLQCVDNLI